MPPDTAKQQKTLELYASLMEEIKLREASALQVIQGQLALPAPLGHEYCYLQIRMIIETIALGCLVMHGDIPATQSNKFQKEFSADAIMKMLDPLHPGFYPQTVHMTTTVNAEGKRYHHIEFLPDDLVPRNVLVKYYARCGDVLHRGSVKKLHKTGNADTADLHEAKGILSCIRKMLEQHLIAMFSPDVKFVCILSDPMAGGKTTAAIGLSSPLD